MRIPQESKQSATEIRQDRQSYNDWFRDTTSGGTNATELEHMKMAIIQAVDEVLAEKQKRYFLLYYAEGLSMYDIGEIFGVEKSCVSRGIKRARKKLQCVLKYFSRSTMSVDWNKVNMRQRHSRRNVTVENEEETKRW